MKLTRLTALFTLLLLLPRTGFGQEFFVDNFDDGDLYDGSPVTWSEGRASDGIDASSGDMVLTSGSGVTIGSGVEGTTYADSIVTTRFRILSDFWQFGTFSRFTSDPNAYYSEFHTNGRIALFKGSNLIDEYQADIDGRANDIWLQMTTLDDAISLKVWEDGMNEPLEPQVSIVDSTFSSGSVGIWFDPGPGSPNSSSVVVRSFAVSPVPEPNTFTMLPAVVLILVGHFRKRRRSCR